MKKRFFLSLLAISLLLFFPIQSSGTLTVDLQFIDTESENRDISELSGTPLLIEWAASWCTVCERNQDNLAEIYHEYKDQVTFVTISIGHGGDSIQDVIEMKEDRGYEWLFGLDNTGYAIENGANNGHGWLVDENLQVVKTWNGSVVSSFEFAEAFEEYFDLENTIENEGEFFVGSNLQMLQITSSFLLITILIRRRR